MKKTFSFDLKRRVLSHILRDPLLTVDVTVMTIGDDNIHLTTLKRQQLGHMRYHLTILRGFRTTFNNINSVGIISRPKFGSRYYPY